MTRRFPLIMPKRKIHESVKNGSITEVSVHDFTDKEKRQFQSSLLKWYNENKRDLPWRHLAKTSDINQRAYAVWVSEVMLQQTQVATVISYYNRWMKKWPTIQGLAEADIETVNEMWSGLGYYSRGRRLFEGAKKVVKELGGEMPKTSETLLKQLPGVGRYTAGAISSIAYNEVTGVVDGNVIRVLCRLRAIGADSTSQVVQDKLWTLANSIVADDNPGDFNQSLMELGARICTPKSPACEKCPVQDLCLAYTKTEVGKKKKCRNLCVNNNSSIEVKDIECLTDGCPLCLQEGESWDSRLGVLNYPRKGKKKEAREETTAVCILCQQSQDGNKYLIVQRPKKGLLAGLWEFPSRDLETDNKTSEEVLESACGIKLKSAVKQRLHVGEVVHIFSHIHKTYIVEAVIVDKGEITLVEDGNPPTRLVSKEEFLEAGTSTAMKKVFQAYENIWAGGSAKKTPGKGTKKVDVNQKSISSFFKPKAPTS